MRRDGFFFISLWPSLSDEPLGRAGAEVVGQRDVCVRRGSGLKCLV